MAYILTPSYILPYSIGTDQISDGSIEQHDLANNINLSHFVNDIGYLTVLSLDDISDVVVPTPEVGQVLTFDGAYWVASDPTGGGTGNVNSSDVEEISVMATLNLLNITTANSGSATTTQYAEITGGTANTTTIYNTLSGGNANGN